MMMLEKRRALAASALAAEVESQRTGEKSKAVESSSQRSNGWLVVSTAMLLQPAKGGGDGDFSDSGRGIWIEGVK